MSRNYDGLAVPGILTRRYFFIPISCDGWLDEHSSNHMIAGSRI
jgi:hypothetical protein